ncbi:hypothetical protein [Burkholderia ubonensis]|uniref:hypothetical protein n=1 Tax=Burkholderia ubonensis TaxID=101571 RepID=UPI000F5B1139|nr:hypothetical protein [Burkholderia ubonensis]
MRAMQSSWLDVLAKRGHLAARNVVSISTLAALFLDEPGFPEHRAKNGPVEPKMARLFLFLFNGLHSTGPRMARNTGQKINFHRFAFLVVRPKCRAFPLMH